MIVNPISGTKGKEKILKELHEHPLCRLVATTGPGDATRLSRQAREQGARAVIAVGGDGTVREVAIPLIGGDVPMGIIPAGSGNGLARHLHIPADPKKAFAIIRDGHVSRIDTAEACGMPFFCTMGLGFDAEVSVRFANSGRRGKFSYMSAIAAAFRSYNPLNYRITLDSGRVLERTAMILTVANAGQYGNNAWIAPHASLTDGVLDLVLLRKGDALHTLEAAPQLFTGSLESNPLVETIPCRSLKIERSAPGDTDAGAAAYPAHLDGDPADLPAEVEVSIVPASLPVITPASLKTL